MPRRPVLVVTLGCSKNLCDSEVLMGQLRAGRVPVEHETDCADASAVVVNTCGFIESAKRESIDEILKYAALRKTGRLKKLFVMGCLSERYRKELAAEIPEVDGFFGTHELPALLAALGVDYRKDLLGERLLATPSHYAYLKVSEGCDRRCSFCAIPLMRGRHVSVPMAELADQARRLARRGVKELILIAQDTTCYGLDLYGKRRLADLLKRLSDIDGIAWIRLHYAYPAGFPMDALDVMRQRPNICKYLDIPLQHISDRLLASMRRGTTKARTAALISAIRERVPGITLRTSLIVGYPGETEREFQELLDWVEKVRFERLGVFEYSHEEGTSAFALKDSVPRKEKRRRAELLVSLASSVSLFMNKSKIGRSLPIMVDRVSGSRFTGRTEADSPEVDNEAHGSCGKRRIKAGEFIEARVTGASEHDLAVEPV
jgi:ribosomal protein S12 methylthiotransferase